MKRAICVQSRPCNKTDQKQRLALTESVGRRNVRSIPALNTRSLTLRPISGVASYRNKGSAALLELELELFLRPTVSRPVRLGIGPPFGTLDHILSCSSFFVWQLLFSSFNAPSLTRERVCSLQCNHSLVRAVTPNNHTVPSHLRLCSLSAASYGSQGLRWKYCNPPPHESASLSGHGQGYITTNSQSVSMSWCLDQSRTIDQSLLSPWNFI
jgi:hypothetical protein